MLKISQKRHLKSLAHPLKPVVIVGAQGTSDAVLAEIEAALAHHELIKVRINAGDREAREAMIERVCQHARAERIQRVGHVVTLFRRSVDKPRIELP